MKSHDCHVLMTQILPVAIRGIMDAHVRETLFGLCNFFDVISRKSVGVRQLRRLQEEIVVILCELEMYFPPAFFDVMVHLLVHIVEDIIQLGPTFLHSMMPFERMNGVIKGYVRNRARPDGSIAKGFLTEECISFCTSYLEIENPVGLPVNRHLGKLAGWGHRDGSREMHVDFKGRIADFERANLVALQHIDVVDPWVVEHKTFIAKTYSDQGQQRTDGDIIKEHNSTFTRWFKDKMLTYPIDEDSSAEEKLIFALSQGAEHNLMTFQAYDINGYTFYTEEKDMKSDYQNSGVTMESYTGDVKQRYYGKIEEIWELSYAGENVPMFRVRWAKNVIKEDRHFTTMVIPEAKSKTAGAKVTAKYEPWVLASQVDQCFFITDPQKPSRVVVRRGKRSIIGMDGAANELDFDQYGDPKMEDDDDDDEEPYTTRRSRTTLPKGRPFKRRSLGVPGLNYSTARKKGKKIALNLKNNVNLRKDTIRLVPDPEDADRRKPPSPSPQGSTELPIIAEISNMANNEEAGGSGSKPFWMLTDEMEVMESQPRRDDGEDDGTDPEYRADDAAEDDTTDGAAEDDTTDGAAKDDTGAPKKLRRERRPNVLSTVKQAFTEVNDSGHPTAPPNLVKGDNTCTLISVTPRHSMATYLDADGKSSTDYTNVKAVLDDALNGYVKAKGHMERPNVRYGKHVFKHQTKFPCVKKPPSSTKDAYYALYHMNKFIRDQQQLTLPEHLRDWANKLARVPDDGIKQDFFRIQTEFCEIIHQDVIRSAGEFYAGYQPSNSDIDTMLQMQGDDYRSWMCLKKGGGFIHAPSGKS
ncbi:hypothetical protein QYE76_043816 [Lolium multiflorum]|uniref:DUF4218 domain-containing protein n=1 Tax=Lolium multiflorum TaxID=4521 RepID=A0AAD8WYJ1_LOLMU|nr:hypothetical protein QYE76_043816 [Lolium multiflorum]